MRFAQCLLLGTALIVAWPLVPARAQSEPEAESDRGVARLSLINGDATIQRGDSGERSAAAINAPLVAGDSVITGLGARVEIQFDNANMLRVAADSEVRIAEITNGHYQLQVGRGTVMFSIVRDSRVPVEIDTPSVSVRPTGRGAYRVTVFDDGRAEITTREGDAEIYTPRGAEPLHQGNTMMVRGTAADPEFQVIRAPEQDDFDRWNWSRDQSLTRSRSYQYVNPDVSGAGDLDANGRWVDVAPYGPVWTPNVDPGWAPYSNGRWVWTDFYGWTWVDYDPWGWAPFHYGRWFYGAGYGWCWSPGPRYVHPYWSPALVAFFGFGGFHIGVGFGGPGFGWVALAPYERLYPWWGGGFYGGYVNRNVLVNNIHVVNNVNITNMYSNARVANGVSVVNANRFGNGALGPVTHMTGAQLSQASLVRGPVPMAPTSQSLRVSDRAVTAVPRNNALNGSFFSHNQPATINRVPFAQQQQSLSQISRPGSAAPQQQASRGGAQPAVHAPATNGNGSTQSAARTPSATPGQAGGWRPVGEGAGPGATSQQAAPRGGTPAGNAGWRQPGDRPSPQMNRSSPSQNSPSDGWRRFQPSSASPYARPSSGGQSYRPESRSQLQIAPPIVRERSTNSYQPRSAPARSTSSSSSSHSNSGGGGGGHSSGGSSHSSGGSSGGHHH